MIREDLEKDQKDLLSCPGMSRLLKMEKELLHYYICQQKMLRPF